MKLICIIVVAGLQQAKDCDLIAETIGGWSVSCEGLVMSLPEFRCAYENGMPKRMTVDEDLNIDLPEDPWLK